MNADIQIDRVNNRTVSQWQDAGMNYIDNAVEPGGCVPLHAHSYDHGASVWGRFIEIRISPEGKRTEQLVERGLRMIYAGWRHSYINVGPTVGNVLCHWPIGHGES